ncbi:MAG TPA: radical SAM protein [Blastocatellia bacterium]|nr:radical SAM protein [Blastocatellia bacterium]
MKVLLVDNLVMPEEGSLALLDVHPHLGLLSLAAVAEADGHTLQIYDPKRLIKSGRLPYDSTLYERAAFDILSERPDTVGFTALGCSFLFALNVAALIKDREPDLPILLGGPHATMLHRQILARFTQFDIIVRYEADEIFPAVLANLDQRSFHDISGLSWRGSTVRGPHFNPGKPLVHDLDRLPIASYHHYPVSDLGLDLLRIEAGRGCPFMCTFCSTASFFQRSFRLKSAARLVTELDRLHASYGFSDFKLDHDLFTVNRRKVLEFCEAVRGRPYRWRASARIDCVDEELLNRMAEAGCVGLYFGIETGSARMQQVAKKRLDLELVEPTLAVAEHLGISTTASFITGYPEELEEDQADTLDLLGRCFSPSCLPQLHMLAPEPGTPIFEQLGNKLEYDGYAGPYNAGLVGSDDEHLVTEHRDIFSTYHYYPAAMPRSHYTFAVETIDVLRRVGPLILKYALRAYGGQLSKLVFALRHWAESNGSCGRPDADLVESYITATFGRRHHLTSLLRYALAAHGTLGDEIDLEERTLAERRFANFDPHRRYQLDSRVRVLSDMHDCKLLIERIANDPDGSRLLDEPETGERSVYLISGSGGMATAYQIDAGLEVMLGLFAQPRSCSEVAELVYQITGARIDASYFAPLVDFGILVASPHAIATQAKAAAPGPGFIGTSARTPLS